MSIRCSSSFFNFDIWSPKSFARSKWTVTEWSSARSDLARNSISLRSRFSPDISLMIFMRKSKSQNRNWKRSTMSTRKLKRKNNATYKHTNINTLRELVEQVQRKRLVADFSFVTEVPFRQHLVTQLRLITVILRAYDAHFLVCFCSLCLWCAFFTMSIACYVFNPETWTRNWNPNENKDGIRWETI